MTPDQLVEIARRPSWTCDYPLIQDSTPKVTLTAKERDELVSLVIAYVPATALTSPEGTDS